MSNNFSRRSAEMTLAAKCLNECREMSVITVADIDPETSL